MLLGGSCVWGVGVEELMLLVESGTLEIDVEELRFPVGP